MLIKQLSIFLENKKGRMADVIKIIGDAGIDIRALYVADTTEFGILRLIVNKPDEALKILREKEKTVSLTDVIGVVLDDKPGALADTLDAMSNNDINIEYMYAFVTSTSGKAYLIMRVERPIESIEILKSSGVPLIKKEDAYNI